MKHIIYNVVICFLALSFFSCNSQQKDNSTKNLADVGNSKTEKELLSPNTNAIGPFHWGINDDGFCKFLSDWSKELTRNGFVSIAENKVKNNGIIPQYDKDGHLDKITIEFQRFSIHPEPDYTEDEKSQIEQVEIRHGQKIQQLIETFSDIYGEPIENSYELSSVELYSFDGLKTITQWQTKETQVSLNIQNKTFNGLTGCEMEMWIEIKKIN